MKKFCLQIITLWRKCDDWSRTSMTIKLVKKFSHQNYTKFAYHSYCLILTTKRAVIDFSFINIVGIATKIPWLKIQTLCGSFLRILNARGEAFWGYPSYISPFNQISHQSWNCTRKSLYDTKLVTRGFAWSQ